MSAQNLGGDGQQKAVGDLTCWLYLTSGLARSLDISFSFKLFPVRYCISLE